MYCITSRRCSKGSKNLFVVCFNFVDLKVRTVAASCLAAVLEDSFLSKWEGDLQTRNSPSSKRASKSTGLCECEEGWLRWCGL